MTIEFHDTCPMCNSLLTLPLPIPQTTECLYCKDRLEIGYSDPTGHHIYEIDPDISGGAMGALHFHLLPIGTTVCTQCKQVYPKTFECCPKLVDLALQVYGHADPTLGPNTHKRISEFLTTKPVVVENTIKLRLWQAKNDDLESDVAEQIEFCAKSLGLSYRLSTEIE